jgi:AbrB family looped-hinge helix DNA binding protein
LSGKSKKEILGMSTISHKFQVTIPKEVRKSQKWSEGDKIVFVIEDDRIYLKTSVEL